MSTEVNGWPKWKGDNIHFDCKEVDSHNKQWNVVVCERIAGKSTLLWHKTYKAMLDGATSIIFKRKVKELNETFVEDTSRIFDKFVGDVKLIYRKQELKNGISDIYIQYKEEVRLLCRVICLSVDIHDLKGAVLPHVKFTFLDECVVNRRIGEKYLSGEMTRILDVLTTYQRESEYAIKNYFFGNPYSTVMPITSFLKVDTRKMYPGALIVGDNYVIQCYQICDKLKEEIMKTNPHFEMNAEYKQFAFDGRFIQDTNIRIYEHVPQYFRLKWFFKVNGQVMAIYCGYNADLQFQWYVTNASMDNIGKRRDIFCFDFGEMGTQTILFNPKDKQWFSNLKLAIMNQQIAYSNAELSYGMEEIFTNL